MLEHDFGSHQRGAIGPGEMLLMLRTENSGTEGNCGGIYSAKEMRRK